ncbi:uncharacterized protein LOC131604997 [Vicia villosa]|uniref:uncharacterized protein LOC131604997 n=1 Tax=Vicia villosa TaxID=3911 RepID=UPI00273BA0F8|nr:uncharacterized protein LOC131604997 [Vicia villosa]
MAAVSITGNAIAIDSHLSMHDFEILKRFKIIIRPPRAPNIWEVLWQPPPGTWTNLNYDGASLSSGVSACGVISKDNQGSFLGAIASPLVHSNSLIVELSGAIFAVEFAHERNWNFVWLELDSKAVVRAFSPPYSVPWLIRNRWLDCINFVSKMNFCCFSYL